MSQVAADVVRHVDDKGKWPDAAYTSLPLNCRSQQENKVLVIQYERAISHIAACEQRGDFPLECQPLRTRSRSLGSEPNSTLGQKSVVAPFSI